jgi:hypothetical protein
MRDILFVALTLGFFVLTAAFVGGCGRIVGSTAAEVWRRR